MIRIIYISVFLCLVSFVSKAQLDPIYNHFHFNQYLINPAYGGLYEEASIYLNTRAQWFGIEGAPFTNTVTFDTSLGDHAGFGLRFMNDRIGISNNTELMASANYIIKSHFVKIGMGLQGGFSTITNNINELDPKVLNDPQLNNFAPNSLQPNFGVGFVVQRFDYFFAASIPRMLENRSFGQNDPRYKRHIYLSTGYRFTLIRSRDTKLQTLVRVVGDRVSFDVSGTYFISDFLWVGTMVRDYYGVSFFAKLNLDKHLSLGYSFELPTNNLIFTNYGTHEISLRYSFTPFEGQQLQDRFF